MTEMCLTWFSLTPFHCHFCWRNETRPTHSTSKKKRWQSTDKRSRPIYPSIYNENYFRCVDHHGWPLLLYYTITDNQLILFKNSHSHQTVFTGIFSVCLFETRLWGFSSYCFFRIADIEQHLVIILCDFA